MWQCYPARGRCPPHPAPAPTGMESNTMAPAFEENKKELYYEVDGRERRQGSNLSIPSRVGAKFKGLDDFKLGS